MTSQLIAPKNLLETCLAAQAVIKETPPDQVDLLGNSFMGMLGFDVNFHGARKLEVHSQVAFGLPDDMTFESRVWPYVEFGRSRIKGELSGVLYRRIKAQPTLVWMMVEPQFRFLEDARENIDSPPHPDQVIEVVEMGGKIRRPVYLPVEQIKSVFVAGR